MSQIVGSKRQSTGISSVIPNTPASVDRIDHKSNGALCVTTYGGSLGKIVDGATPNTVYTGECAAGFSGSVGLAIWRIKKEVTAGAVVTTTWACVPASGSVPARLAGFDHIWTNRAALTYL